MDDFVIVDNVPVFDQHDEYDEAILQKIVDNNNRRIADTSDACPLVIGHTDPDLPEDQQPEVVGYATNFRLSTIGKLNPRRCIVATFKFLRDKWEKAKQFPRRSVELWKDELFFDPISLLGASTPKRDLSIVYAKPGEKFTYSLQENEGSSLHTAMDEKETLLKDVLAKCEETDVFQFVRQLMKERAEKEEDKPKDEDEPEKNAEDEESDDEKKEDKDRMQKDQLRADVEKFRREADATRRELELFKRKQVRAERERDLVKMETQEGIIFDLAEELDLVSDLSAEQFSRHQDRMRKRYQRLPDASHIRPVADHTQSESLSKDQMLRAVDLATSKKISNFAEAINLVRGGNA